MINLLKSKWNGLKNLDAKRSSGEFFTICRWFNIQLTNAFGIVTTIHWTVSASILALLLLSGQEQAWLFFIAMLSVVPHEYGHSIAGKYYGIKTSRILIYPVGGVALMEGMPKKWYQEIVVALAGPAVSLGLTIIGFLGTWAEGPTKLLLNDDIVMRTYDPNSFWVALFIINLSLTIFNLLPAFPMDGGRVFRALLTPIFGHLRATQFSFYLAVVLSAGMVFLGLFLGSLSFIIVAVLVALMARHEYLNVKKEAEENLI